MNRLARAFRRECGAWIVSSLRGLPGSSGRKLRAHFYEKWFRGTARRLTLTENVSINGWENISVGDEVSFGRGCCLEATAGTIEIGSGCAFNFGVWVGSDHGKIVLGRNVIVGPYTVMRSANHRFDIGADAPFSKQGHDYGEIVIGDDVWIGAHVTILAGTNIGRRSVVAAGAVVRGDIPPGSLAGGIPAKVIRELGQDKKQS